LPKFIAYQPVKRLDLQTQQVRNLQRFTDSGE